MGRGALLGGKFAPFRWDKEGAEKGIEWMEMWAREEQSPQVRDKLLLARSDNCPGVADTNYGTDRRPALARLVCEIKE